MNKKIKKVLSVLLATSMILAVTACGKKTSEEGGAGMTYGEVWSYPTTTKVMQDEKIADKGAAKLEYKVVRNEYESVQLMLTAKKDISSFVLSKADLKNGDHVLSAENIDIYVQKYAAFDDNHGKGIAPDALLPMDVADSYKENKIVSGDNGGLWVTIYIPKETVAGVYEGTFELTVDGKSGEKKLDIPVSVEVADYTLTDEVTADTLFSWRYERVATGELDGSAEMMTHYYEFFLDYRLSLQSMPMEALTGEEVAENVQKYYDRITTYSILSEVGNISTNLDGYPSKIEEQILSIAEVCTEETNYLDKAIIYFMDEPEFQLPDIRASVMSRTATMQGYLDACVDKIKADNTGKYDTFKKHANWEESISDIPCVLPVSDGPIQWLRDNEYTEEGQAALKALNCVCPQFDIFTEKNIDFLLHMQEAYDIDLWWYGMSGSYSPGPNYFVGEKNLLNARTASWIQKKYDVVGNLYWDAAAYTAEEGNPAYEFVDLWDDPDRDRSGIWMSGDGNLCYPGAAYGCYGPLPSIRLMSIRDGMEEYEMLVDMEKTYESLASSFGADFSVKEAMEIFYTTLAYNVASMYAHGEANLDFLNVRAELIDMLVGLQKGTGFAMGNIAVENKEATFTYYVPAGSTVKIDGKEQTPIAGLKYQYVQDVAQNKNVTIEVKNADGEKATYKQFIAVPLYVLCKFQEEATLAGVTVTDGSTAAIVADKGLHLNVKGVVTGNALMDAAFVPQVSVATSLFGENQLKDFETVNVGLYNPGKDFTANVRLYDDAGEYTELGEVLIAAGETTVKLDIKKANFDEIKEAKTLAFEFINAADGKALSYEFYLSSMLGEK